MCKNLLKRFLSLLFPIVMTSGLISCATTSTDTVYLIKLEEGDTLSKIATKYDTTWQKIARLNNIKPGTSVSVGTVIRVMPGPGGLITKKGKRGGIFGRTAKNDQDDEELQPDLEQDDDGKSRGLFFNNGGANAINWPVYGKVSSAYGKRGRRFHHGIDIRAKRGTKVYSAGTGVVEFSGRQNGYGKLVIVRHQKMKTAYAHLSKINVEVGQKVGGTTIIGEVGSTGNSSGPHLHFETRSLADKSINPYNILDTKQLLSGK